MQAIVIIGNQQTGKTKLVNWLITNNGGRWVYYVDSNFNSYLNKADIIVCDEIMDSQINKLRQLITCKNIVIHEQLKEPIEIPNNKTFIITTNNPNLFDDLDILRIRLEQL